MIGIDAILDNVLSEIVPSSEEIELIDNIVLRLKHLLKSKAQELGIQYTSIEPQGSTGIKQTQLREDFDIDLFIGLDYLLYQHKYEGLSKNKLKKASKKDFLRLCNHWILKSLPSEEFKNPRLLYAEHPYVTVDCWKGKSKIKIDIVLYFKLDKEYIQEKGPITAVDRSPWHGRFVKENLTAKQKNDVRLLKQFFKANHVYGDKSGVGKIGFIGYSAELLLYHYKSFIGVLSNFNTLKSNPIDFHGRSKEELMEISHFQNDFLIITDPIDRNRNVASAISEKSYKYCNFQVKKFVENPSLEYFTIRPIPLINPKNINPSETPKYFIIELNNKDPNVHYTICRDKLYSLGDLIKSLGEKEFSHEERFGTIIFEVFFEDELQEYNLGLYCNKPIISESYSRRGPPVNQTKHANKFKSKNPSYFEKNGHLWVETNRKYDKFLDFLKGNVPKNLPEYLVVVNISDINSVQSISGRKTIYILKNMIIPFQ